MSSFESAIITSTLARGKAPNQHKIGGGSAGAGAGAGGGGIVGTGVRHGHELVEARARRYTRAEADSPADVAVVHAPTRRERPAAGVPDAELGFAGAGKRGGRGGGQVVTFGAASLVTGRIRAWRWRERLARELSC